MFILKLFIILDLLLLPFGELLRFDTGNNLAVKPLDITVGLTAVWWIINIFVRTKKKNYFFTPFFAFIIIGLFSLFINLSWLKPQEFFISTFYLLRFIAYFLLFPVVLHLDQKFKNKIIFLLLFDGIAFLIFGFLQYFFYNSLKNLYYLGWDEHLHRIFSTFFDPNFAGAFYVLFFIFVSSLLVKSWQKKKIKINIILGFLLLVILFAIFLTFSRAALIMLFIGTIVFLSLIKKKKLIILLLLSIVLFILVASPKFNDENMNLFREASSKARIDNYALALRIIKDQPILGVGFNTYRYAKLKYGIRERMDIPSHADAGVDNSFLFVLATTGILGFAAYLWLWSVILKSAFFLHQQKNIGVVVAISSTFALFANALFINSLFFAPLMLWIWIIIGLMED